MSRFRALGEYEASLHQGYKLLPFKFDRLEENQYVLTNQVGEYLAISKSHLTDFIDRKLSPIGQPYEDLKAKHFLLDNDSSVAIDLLSLKLRTKIAPLSQFTSLHMFVVTLRCEHSCPYCQVSRQSEDRDAFDMSRETAEKSLDLVFRSPSQAVKIEFQGGEPLLNFDLIKYIVLRAREINSQANKNLGFVIATNLALINSDILEFCREHDVHISTSLDGPKEIHNKNRPRPGGDSYERAVAGIHLARSVLGKNKVSALMTTTEISLERGRDIIDEYVRQGFTGIFLRSLSPYGFAIKTKYYRAYDTAKWLQFYFDGLDYIIELNKSGFAFTEYYAATILKKMLTPYQTTYVDLMSPAGIGIAALIYNYDGSVFASDESRMLAEMGDKTFLLGNVHSDSYQDIMLSDALLNPLEESFAASAPMCTDCAFEPYCGADPVYHYATQKDFTGRKPISGFCHRNMGIFKRLISLMEKDGAIKELFHSWAYL